VPLELTTILVPLDGSEFSARALPVAGRLARRLGADVHLLSAVASEDEVPERKAELAAIEVPGPELHCSVVVSRDPAGAIHEALRRIPGAVACMASHGRGRSAALVGSVATEVVGRGHDPLVVVGPLVDDRPRGRGVVAAVDDTPASAKLVPFALEWADTLDERALVITVAEPVPPPLRADKPVRRLFGPDGDVEAFLDNLVEPFRSQGHELVAVPWYDPVSPAEGLHTYLREHPAFLVAVSSHARVGLTRVVFGSTAAAIVHRSPSPVLVVPRPDARPTGEDEREER
jgi:nucleotide-binding universal stress UspA family protein